MQTATAPVPDDAAHLLVVDDDRRIRDLLSRYLQREGYRVTTAKDANDARAKLDGLAFDLLILDVMMPGMTGPELQSELKIRGHDIPIVFITANRDDSLRRGVLEQGAVECLHKPFSDTALFNALQSALRTN